MRDSIFRAEVETVNFQFEGYGSSECEAMLALRRAWDAHCKQYRGASLTWNELYDDIHVEEIELGQGYRDREPIGPKASVVTQ